MVFRTTKWENLQRKILIYFRTFANILDMEMADTEKIKSIIAQGEGINIEFKKSHDTLTRDVYETICAFLNRKGGIILLGVKNNGTIEGIREDTITTQLRTLANETNNPQIISPTVRLETEILEINGKKIICIHVPESLQAHTHKNIYFDRNEEGDYRLDNYHLVSNLYLRKQSGFTENRIFPHLRIDDFVQEDFDFVRRRLALFNDRHPWISMDNEEMLRSAKMYLRDEQTKTEGYTLAAVLMFGKSSALAMACPHYKTDALCRKEDTNRYDDRDVVDCNLIQAYGRLMAFIRKHLPDRFFLEEDRRTSYREIIFREVISNLLTHREFTNPYPARLIIYKTTVVTENWNIPHTMGRITPDNLIPYPKNPTIAGFFRQLEWFDDLGSGVRNMFHYCPLYVKDKNALPIMEENDVFKLTVPYEKPESIKTSISQAIEISVNIKHADRILELIRYNPKITAIAIGNELSLSENHIRKILSRLVKLNIIEREGSDKNGEWVIIENDRVKIG
ncbi:MAG: putative DNA binding domain-containing protein [Prevotellaceae bacterium]|jgi:ATP-dependent DNA helicase RecG|nr:putative DNA binding domain-containing protein [Prevotellaceae bacterium]